MTEDRLDDLTAKNLDIVSRGARLPKEQLEAQAAFIEAVRVDADPSVVEAMRLRCSAIFEAQLDLIIEAAHNERELIREMRRG